MKRYPGSGSLHVSTTSSLPSRAERHAQDDELHRRGGRERDLAQDRPRSSSSGGLLDSSQRTWNASSGRAPLSAPARKGFEQHAGDRAHEREPQLRRR